MRLHTKLSDSEPLFELTASPWLLSPAVGLNLTASALVLGYGFKVQKALAFGESACCLCDC